MAYQDWNASLMKAVTYGNLSTVQQCVSNRADINHYDLDGNTPLIKAIVLGTTDIITYLLSIHVDTERKDKITCGTPLLWAAKHHRSGSDVIAMLLRKGAAVNEANFAGETPLSIAVQYGYQWYVTITKDLIAARADVNHLNSNGCTPLATIVKKGNMDLFKYLIEAGADLYLFGRNGKSPLLEALFRQRWEMAEYLLNKGLNVNHIDYEGNTVLTTAVKTGNEDAVKYLVQNGADVCKAGCYRSTPLAVAVETQNLNLVKYLLGHGAESTIPSAFLIAIEVGKLDIVELLTQEGYLQMVKHAIQDDDNNSYLVKAAETGNSEMVKFLLGLGGNLNLPVENGCTPLTKAVERENFDLVKYLVKNGANIDQMDSRKKNALIIAASNSSHSIVKYLIDSGANIELAKIDLDVYLKWNKDLAVYLKFCTISKVSGTGHEAAN